MSLEITSEIPDDIILFGLSSTAGPFQILSDDEILDITNHGYQLSQVKRPVIRRRLASSTKHTCDCGGSFARQDDEMICDLCGLTEAIEIEDASSIGMSNYNTSSESANPLRIIGPGGSAMQRKLLCKTSDYDKTRLRDTMQQMIASASAYKQCTVPHTIVKEAGQRYYDLQRVCEIKRGDVRRGAMATCLRLICDRHGLHKKRNIFAEMFQITLSDLSEGEKLLDRLFSDGKLNRDDFLVKNQENARAQGYLIQYFVSLNIPLPPDLYQVSIGSDTIPKVPYNPDKPYYEFVKRLIEFTYHFQIAESSVLNSKCIGAIWIMATRCPELGLLQDQLATECKISKSTFKRFSTIIENLLSSQSPKEDRLKKKLKHLFHKYNINDSIVK